MFPLQRIMRVFQLLAVIIVTIGCESKNRYQIKGEFTSVTDERWIYLVKFMEPNPTMDSVKIENGKFNFNGSIDFPEIYGLHFNPKRLSGVFPIFLEPGELHVKIDPKNWELGSSVEGGIYNEEFKAFEKSRMNEFVYPMAELKELLNATQKLDEATINDSVNLLMKRMTNMELNYVKSNTTSPVSIFIFSKLYLSLPVSELGRSLELFSPQIKATSIYKAIYEYYKTQEMLEEKTLAFENKSGNKPLPVSLENGIIENISNYNSNKFLYVDIWGPWCGPCIKEFPAMRSLQEKFAHDKIEFVFLCVQSAEDKWREAIEKEQLKGQHFLINKPQLERLTEELDGMTGVPRYLLVDSIGNIIDKSAPKPSSPEIVQRLNKLIKTAN